MKLLSSFKKEIILATRSFYFYIEIGFAVIILIVLLFAIPEHTNMVQTEYIYMNLSAQGEQYIENELQKQGIDDIQATEIEAGDVTYNARLITTDESEIYLLDSENAVRELSEQNMNIGAVISMDDSGELQYKYYLQGYESDRLKNLMSVLHNVNTQDMMDKFESQEVRSISTDYVPLNDKQNAIPPLLAFSGSLMGMFIMAAFIFLDREEGVIKAYAITASSVSRYLLSKVFVLLLTSVVSGLIVVVPIMGFQINYALMLLLLITTGFFASTLGLLLGTFFSDMMKSFGVVFIFIIILLLPSLAYFIPSWDPVWIKIIPSYPMLQSFKEIMLKNGDAVYVLLTSAGFTAGSIILFAITNIRFRKTLSV